MAEWLRYWTINHDIVGSSPAMHYRSSVPKVLGQDLHPKMCLEVIVNMQLIACPEPHKINQSI